MPDLETGNFSNHDSLQKRGFSDKQLVLDQQAKSDARFWEHRVGPVDHSADVLQLNTTIKIKDEVIRSTGRPMRKIAYFELNSCSPEYHFSLL